MRFSLLQVETARQPARCPVEESTLDAATRKRSGAILSRAVSNALYYNNSWHAGQVGTTWATDSLNPWAPKTEFYYDYCTVNPSITG